MGVCSVEMYGGSQGTCAEDDFIEIYDAADEDECINVGGDGTTFGQFVVIC